MFVSTELCSFKRASAHEQVNDEVLASIVLSDVRADVFVQMSSFKYRDINLIASCYYYEYSIGILM